MSIGRIRCLIALTGDSEMTVGEALGLLKDDIIIGDSISHVRSVPHSWRGLKKKGSITVASR